jgi:16S rRNA processing protein RimM
VAGVVDRDAAEALRGTLLYVPRGRLPEAGEEEWYHADLIGLQATDQDGAALGRVTAVHDFGAGDLLEIDPGAGETVLVPFTRDAVPEVDVASGRIVVRAPDPTEQPKPLPAKPRPAKTKGGNRP